MSIHKVLQSLGVDGDEARTYMVLLEQHTPITAGVLSKQLGMARASLYGFLKRLQEKWIIKESTHNNVKTFYPEPPQKLDMLFKKQIGDLENSRKEFKALLPEIEKKAGLSMGSPRFTFFDGAEGVRHVLNDILLYPNSATSAF